MNANSKFIFRFLSVFSLILILPFPTEFYFFSRVVIFIGAIYAALEVKKIKSSEGDSVFFLLCGIAFIFNPIVMIFLYSKGLWAVLNIIAAVSFYRAASLIDDVQMETLSAKTNNINQSPNTKTPQVQDEKQEADKDGLQKKSLISKTEVEGENDITEEDIQNFRDLNFGTYLLKTNEISGDKEFIPNFDFLPEEDKKKINIIKKTNPKLFNELFGAETREVRNHRARERARESARNPSRDECALSYFLSCVGSHLDRGGKAEFFYMVGKRKFQMERHKDIGISFWQYTRIEAEAYSFVKYHLKQNKKDELIRVRSLYVTSRDPKLEEIRAYLKEII